MVYRGKLDVNVSQVMHMWALAHLCNAIFVRLVLIQQQAILLVVYLVLQVVVIQHRDLQHVRVMPDSAQTA